MAFVVKSLATIYQTRIDESFDDERPFAVAVFIAFSILVWVRKLEYFRYGFILAVISIFTACAVIASFCIGDLIDRDWVKPQDTAYYSVNPDRYWDMVGFSFFMFEGIGCVMPVMDAC